jgi:hypothetical protein
LVSEATLEKPNSELTIIVQVEDTAVLFGDSRSFGRDRSINLMMIMKRMFSA